MGTANNNRALRQLGWIKKEIASLESDYEVFEPRGRIKVRFKPGVRETILPTLEANPWLDVRQLANNCAVPDPKRINAYLGICELASEVKQAFVYKAINLLQAHQITDLSFKQQCEFVWNQIPPEDESDPFRFFDPRVNRGMYIGSGLVARWEPDRQRICDQPIKVYSVGGDRVNDFLRKKQHD